MATPGNLELSLLMNGQKPLWLPGCDFRETSLQNSDLRGAWLASSQFDNASLDGAILNGANLAFCRFDDANLERANLNDARLSASGGIRVAPQPERHQNRIRCKDCGGALSVTAILSADGGILMRRILPDHLLTYCDTG